MTNRGEPVLSDPILREIERLEAHIDHEGSIDERDVRALLRIARAAAEELGNFYDLAHAVAYDRCTSEAEADEVLEVPKNLDDALAALVPEEGAGEGEE